MPKLEIQLLGSPRVHAARRELRFRTRKTLALLAVLAVTAGAHRREALADMLWGELGVDAARREFRKALSYLTAALGECAGALVATRETLELRADDLTCDVTELAVAAGPGAPEAQLEAALMLYRGEFMLGFEVTEPAAAEWWRWQRETCRATLERVVQALIGAQAASGQVETAERWLRCDPANENAHRALMEAHLATGDPGAALTAFEACRTVLARELELSPGVETRAVAARARARLGFVAPAGLVGRGVAWQALEHASLTGGICLICGEPGIGKTRLALEFAATHGEALVLWAEEPSRGTPLEAVALALRAALTDPARRARLEGLEAVWRVEVARLLPEFGAGGDELTTPAPEGRTRLLEGLLRALFAALGPQGVLVLDNLHSFDPDSAALALTLARRTGGLTLACVRVPELEANLAVRSALEHFERHGNVTRLALEPLSEAEVSELLGLQSNASQLHQISGGNPLYALEAARHPDSQGARRGVLELVRRRVARLGEPVRRLLEAASLCGEAFSLEVARRAADLSETVALEANELALEAELIVDGSHGGRFSHGLIRQAVAEGLSGERQRSLHRRLAMVLTETGLTEPGRIAEHLELGGLPRDAIPYRLRASVEASRLHAYELALTQQNRALSDGLDDAGFAALFEPRYRLFVALADWTDLEAELRRFEATAARLESPELIAFVQMGWTDFCFRVGRYADGIDRATRLLHHKLPNAIEAQTRYSRGLSLLSLERTLEAERDCLEALGCAPASWWMRGWVLNTLALCQSARGAFPEALTALEESQSWFHLRGDRHGVANAQRVTAPILAQYGYLRHALNLLEEALTTAQEIGQVFMERAVLETTVKLHLERFGDAANAGVNQPEDDFFHGASRAAILRALPWLERCLERATEPHDSFLEPLWRGRVARARWLLARELPEAQRPVARA